MQTYLKTKPVWMQLLLFIGMALGLFVIAGYIGAMVLANMTGLDLLKLQDSKNWDLSNPGYTTYMRGMILLQFLFLWVIPCLLFSYFSDTKPKQYLGLQSPGKHVYWLAGILVMLVAFPFVEYIGYINQKILVSSAGESWVKTFEETAARQLKVMFHERTPAELIKNLVFIALFAGIGEELFFRGILQRLLIRSSRNPWVGIIVTAVVFSAFHLQFYGFLPRLFLGVLLGAIYWYSGSLWVAILVHFLYDAVGVVLIHLNPQMMENISETVIKGEIPLLLSAMVSLALTFVILHQMQKQSVTSFDEIYGDDLPKQKDDFSF
jgi:membrane protease YdiL (CAAX protease family)